MLGLVALAMAIIYLLPRLTKAVPSALVAIVAIALLTNLAGIETRAVGDLASIKGGLPRFHLPDVPWNLATLRIVFPYALIMALVGLIESLLTLNLIDDITDTRGKPNRECLAQGSANIIQRPVRVFAWQHARQIAVRTRMDADGAKIYLIPHPSIRRG